MNNEKKLHITIIFSLIFLFLFMPIILAKTFTVNEDDPSEETMTNHYIIEGNEYILFCRQRGTKVGIGDRGRVNVGSTMSVGMFDEYSHMEDGNLFLYTRAPIYHSVEVKNLPKYLAYLVTEEKDASLSEMSEYTRRLIQLAAWDGGLELNTGSPINGVRGVASNMPSYAAKEETGIQKRIARNFDIFINGNEDDEDSKGLRGALEAKIKDIKYPSSDHTGNKVEFIVTSGTTPSSDELKSRFDEAINGNTNTGKKGIKAILSELTEKNIKAIQDAYEDTLKLTEQFKLVEQKEKLEKDLEDIKAGEGTSEDELVYKDSLYAVDKVYALYTTMDNAINNFKDQEAKMISAVDSWNADVQRMTVTGDDTRSNPSYMALLNKCTSISKIMNGDDSYYGVNSMLKQYDNLLEECKSLSTEIKTTISDLASRMSILQAQAEAEAEEAINGMMPLVRYGKAYEEFYTTYISEDGTEEGKDINYPTHVEDTTDKEETKVLVDNKDQIYTIGPFSMEYPNYYYITDEGKRTYFDWIEDIYLIDKNGHKKENIEIVTEDKELTGPENLAPEPGEKFWIKFKNENDDGGKLDLESLKVRVKFKYLRNCLGKYETYEASPEESLGYTWEYQATYDEETGALIDEWYECFEDGVFSHQLQYAVEASKIELNFDLDDEDDDRPQYWDNITPTSVYDTYELELYADILPLGMEIGGIVFEDEAGGKEMITNGIYVPENGDVLLPGIEVSLYEFENERIGKLAKLATEESTTNGDENTVYEEKNRQNPTLTDENGRYLFKGVDPMKKYIVMFTYNGQTYMPIDYKVGASSDVKTDYDSVSENPGVQDSYNWRINSKSTETIEDRDSYDSNFASIGSSPANYRIRSKALESRALYDGNYNKTYSEYDLAGITLNAEGRYVQTGPQLIDAYIETTSKEGTKIVGKKSSSNYKQGLITKKILEYIEKEKKYPEDLRNEIYAPIVRDIGGDTNETWRKLQFIEDCKINAYTGDIRKNNNNGLDVYPIYSRFVIDTVDYKDLSYYHKNNSKLHYGVDEEIDPELKSRPKAIVDNSGAQQTTETVYKALYKGQYYLNLGLGIRHKLDVALKKDVYKATLQINGKTQVYNYNQREADMITDSEKAELKAIEAQYGRNSEQYLEKQIELEDKSENGNRFWEIQARILDYATYYSTEHNYNRELYKADHSFPGNDGKDRLEAYITYKITIRNQSQSILTQIDEIVDYYDNTYEPVWNKSWVMYKNDSGDRSEAIKVRDQEFYDIMVGDRQVADGQKYRAVTSQRNGFKSQYSQTTQFDNSFKSQGYDTIYVDGLKGKQLKTGESAYIYLTFKVKGDGDKLSLSEATTDPGKQNIAEINGYSSFYADGTSLPNEITKNSNNVAGLIDIDSNPGNFTVDHLKNRAGNARYEQNFEDDADRARGIKLSVEGGDRALERVISGVAWEDKRDTLSSDALIGNGIRQDGEVKIKGVRVDLLEVELDQSGNVTFDGNGDIKLRNRNSNGITTLYDKDGRSTVATTYTDESGNYVFKGIVPGDYIVRFTYGGGYTDHYNGQDYKTTTYQTGIEQAGRTDTSKDADPGYVGYTNYGTYDDKGNNYAQNASGTYGYDINKADYNTSGNVSDAKDLWRLRAKVNNYSSSNYGGVIYDKAHTLDTDVANGNNNANTQMIADTGVMRLELEYNRQHSTQNTNTMTGDIEDNNSYGGTSTGERDYQGQNNSAQNNHNGVYHIQNVDLGLEERPKAGLELNKKVSNVKIVLANQTVLFDASQSVSNLIWQPKSKYDIYSKKTETRYDDVAQRVRNGSQNVYSDYTKYDIFRNEVVNERINTYVNHNAGLIQATMDEELMHGATIKITYDFTVDNIGEVDYRETDFYYTGKAKNSIQNIVKTSADYVIDYVANNLQFKTESNDKSWDWQTIRQADITNTYKYVNADVAAELPNYNTIIITKALGKKLKDTNALIPQESSDTSKAKTTHIPLVLSQLITSQNKDDDLSYGNIAEIVQISNDVGRRMAYSVQGNQKPSELPHEADASKAEQVLILPPFGNGGIILYVALGSLIAAILAAGIVVIKKVVLGKTKE